jgi:hypothetical protein
MPEDQKLTPEKVKKAVEILKPAFLAYLKMKGILPKNNTKPTSSNNKRWTDIEGLTDEQKEARGRIEKDVEIMSANAEEAGLSFPDYLKSIGLDDARAQRLIDYVKAQPVEYPGYREVEPGETLPLGSEVKMDRTSGKSFVKMPKTAESLNADILEEGEKKNLSEVEMEIQRSFGTVFDEMRERIETLTKQLEEANKKLQKYDEEAALRAAKKELNKIKKRKAATKEELDDEFKSLSKKLHSVLAPTQRKVETRAELVEERKQIISAFNKSLSSQLKKKF